MFLLSLSHEQAVDLDASQRDSCAGLSDDQEMVHAAEVSVPLIARWADVQRARKKVIKSKEGLAILQLRASGFSELEIARLSGTQRLALRRRWRATVDEILAELGGYQEVEPPVSRVSACLHCGASPRVRLVAVAVKGRTPTREEREHQASVCHDCLSPELRSRIVGGFESARMNSRAA